MVRRFNGPFGRCIPEVIDALIEQKRPVRRNSKAKVPLFGWRLSAFRYVIVNKSGMIIPRNKGSWIGIWLMSAARKAPAATPAAKGIPVPAISPESFIAKSLIFVKILINFVSSRLLTLYFLG